MRFFTVPDAKAARGSVGWAVFLIGSFYLMVMVVGVGARAILGQGGEKAAGPTGNLAIPELALNLGGGEGSTGGDIFLAVISAVALATILAVVAGLVISASGAVAHDVWSNVIRKGRDSDKEEVWVAKLSAVGIGVLAIVVALAGGAGFNISVLVGMAFCYASSVELPGAAAGAVVAALQHDGRRGRHAQRADRLDRADRAERAGVAGRRLRHGLAARVARRSTTRRSSASRSGSWAATWAPCSRTRRATTASTTSCTCAPRPASAPRARRGARAR